MSKIRIFSYLPNPRVWKSIITAKIGGIDIEVVGDKPNNMPNWLWDFDAKPISEEDKSELKSFEIKSKRGFKGSLFTRQINSQSNILSGQFQLDLSVMSE